MIAKIIAFLTSIDPKVIAGAVTGILLWLVGLLGGKYKRASRERRIDARDTRDQVELDRNDAEKTDDEVADDFRDKFGSPV